ncbi:MAG: enamine deaminase RidA, partial [Dehalococcoidales bacterium]|nr:enamine deaminase RidA [Dehalococcoidales bacterium]
MEILKPESWRAPQGYSNGIAVDTPGRIVYLAGQVGWDETETFHS